MPRNQRQYACKGFGVDANLHTITCHGDIVTDMALFRQYIFEVLGIFSDDGQVNAPFIDMDLLLV